jgi:hypothetical protein
MPRSRALRGRRLDALGASTYSWTSPNEASAGEALPQFEEQVVRRSPAPLYRKLPGLSGVTLSGDYPVSLAAELDAVEGGKRAPPPGPG